jgi:hypothetical protein
MFHATPQAGRGQHCHGPHEYGRVILPLVLLRRLDRAKLLYLVLSKVTEVDLHPDKVSNVEMG